MKKAKLILSFQRHSDANLKIKAESILQMVTGNTYFPAPVPPLAQLEAALDAYKLALLEAQGGDRVKIATKRACRIALEDVLGQLARYIMYVANGSPEMLVSSGYELVKHREPSVLHEPGVVNVKHGISSGRLVANLKRVQGAYGYLYQITPDPLLPESKWQSMPLKRSTCIFENLKPGQKYWIRVAAIGTGTQIAYSSVTSQIAV